MVRSDPDGLGQSRIDYLGNLSPTLINLKTGISILDSAESTLASNTGRVDFLQCHAVPEIYLISVDKHVLLGVI